MLNHLIEPDSYKYECEDCGFQSNDPDYYEVDEENIRLCTKCYDTQCEICHKRGAEANDHTIETEHDTKKVCSECYLKDADKYTGIERFILQKCNIGVSVSVIDCINGP